ncbi:ROK family protein [Candidatus Saccharibacteria bacterium]|nr:ROK family protein [Candidatus Saccharibacteria bacterium]
MYIAVDIGGTKTLLALFSKRGRLKKRLKMQSWAEPEKWLSELNKNLPRILPRNRKSVLAVTFSFPGVIENGHPVRAHNLPKWDGKEIEKKVKELFEKYGVSTPIFYKNDADLGALYECYKYSGKTLYLTFGTGIGGGIVKDKKLSKESATFEPARMSFSYQGKKYDRWEQIASSKAIRAANNDLDVRKIWKEDALNDVACRISLGLTKLIKDYNPDQIVLSGPIAEIFYGFEYTLRKILIANFKDEFAVPPIYPGKKPQESVIYGAYLYGKSKS